MGDRVWGGKGFGSGVWDGGLSGERSKGPRGLGVKLFIFLCMGVVVWAVGVRFR